MPNLDKRIGLGGNANAQKPILRLFQAYSQPPPSVLLERSLPTVGERFSQREAGRLVVEQPVEGMEDGEGEDTQQPQQPRAKKEQEELQEQVRFGTGDMDREGEEL